MTFGVGRRLCPRSKRPVISGFTSPSSKSGAGHFSAWARTRRRPCSALASTKRTARRRPIPPRLSPYDVWMRGGVSSGCKLSSVTSPRSASDFWSRRHGAKRHRNGWLPSAIGAGDLLDIDHRRDIAHDANVLALFEGRHELTLLPLRFSRMIGLRLLLSKMTAKLDLPSRWWMSMRFARSPSV
jgi:hypothetical protein